MADTAKFVIDLKDNMSPAALKAAKSLGATTKSIMSAKDAISEYERRSRKANAKILASEKARVDGVKKMFLGAAAVSAVAATAGAAAGAAFVGAAFVTGDRVAKTERLTSMFDRLTHHGKETFGKVSHLAQQFGLDIDQTAKSYGNFLKLQFSEKEATKLIKLGADLQALGSTADEVQGVFLALGQIKSKGRLQGEEMLQLQERGISGKLVKEEIAKLMGVAEDEVDSLQSAGKVKSDVALLAIERALNRKLNQKAAGESGREFAETTMTGMVNVLKSRGKALWIQLADAAGPGIKSGLKSIQESLGDLFSDERFIRRASELMESFGVGIAKVGEFMGEVLPIAAEIATVFGESVVGGFNDATEGGRNANNAMVIMKDLMTSAIPVAEAFGSAIGVIAGFSNDVGDVLAAIAGFGGDVADTLGIGMSVEDELARMKELREEAAKLREAEATKSGREFGAGFASGIAQSNEQARLAGANLALAADAGFKSAAEIHSPSKLMQRRGGQMTDGLGIGMEMGAPNGTEMLSGLSLPDSARIGSGSGPVSVDVNITIDGSGDPEAVAAAAMSAFEDQMGSVFTRLRNEVAA